MEKTLFVSEQDLINLMEEHFDVQANTNVITVLEDGEEITKDVIELHPAKKDVDTLITLISETLSISECEIMQTNIKNDKIVLMVDFIDLKTLLESKYNTRLTSDYKACDCDLFKKIMFAFQVK